MEHPWIFARCREVQSQPNGYLDLWAREHYKDLADTTPMLTANRGWTTHGDLAVGDLVYGPDGKPVPVLALSERFNDSHCYRITFSDGATVVAGAGHLWRVRRKIRRRVSNGRSIEWSREIVRTAELVGGADVGALARAVEGSPSQLLVHPYVLGCWLGDGCSASGRIGCADREIFERIESLGYRLSASHCPNRTPFEMRTVYGMQAQLRELEVLGAKKIPAQYLRGSAHQRMELLRGLMDTGGHCNERGTAAFWNQNAILSEQVWELATGLALRPRIRKYDGVAKPFWQVSMQAHRDRNPFALRRKAKRAIAASPHRNCRDVAAIQEVTSVPTRCIQVEGGMYLAGRELVPTHNSTIITFGQTLQDILRDAELTVGIFSHTRPIAKAFLRQLKREMEDNVFLKGLFPDVLYANPAKESPKWSEDDGIIVRRKSNPAAATVEAWGLVDGQPTSKHYRLMVYDDVVEQGAVGTPEMMQKTTQAWELSRNLTSQFGQSRYIGTRYHFNDSYGEMLRREAAKERIYPATVDGTPEGTPVLMSAKLLAEKRRDMGPYTFSCQMLLNPVADESQGFKPEWLLYYERGFKGEYTNRYIIVDPANAKKKKSDYTSAWVVGVGADANYYILDMVRDRLNLTERTEMLFQLHRKWQPLNTGYESYGIQSDIQHIQDRMMREHYHFGIKPLGGTMGKIDRIRRLIPLFENGKIWLPPTLFKTGYDGKVTDLVSVFVEEEYKPFPVPRHDDMLDALARVCDEELGVLAPAAVEAPKRERYKMPKERHTSWMAR